jgi:hypothetical protein
MTPSSYAEYQQHLTSLFRPDDTLCFVAINHETGATPNDFVKFEEAVTPEYFAGLQQLNETASIYVAMNAYKPELVGKRTGRTEDNVVAIRALYADADRDGDAVLAAMEDSNTVPTPPIVLQSSPGKYNVVWPVDNVTKDEAKPILKTIIAEFNTDPAIKDVARILRVPGFVNRKYPDAPPVRVVSSTTARHVAADFKFASASAAPTPASTQTYEKYVMPEPGVQITESRNNACKSFAAHIWYFDITPEELKEKVYKFNQDHCVPPLSENELDSTVLASTVKNKQRKDNEPPVYSGGKLVNQHPDPVVEETHHFDVVSGELAKMHAAGASAQAYLEYAIKISEVAASAPPVPWRSLFRSVGELEAGGARMLIEEILPEGIIYIGGLPGEGKSLLALSITKALTTGQSFLGQFDVPDMIPVLYMIPESSAGAFRKRCETFQISNDPSKFLCRTISEGATLSLHDPSLLDAVRAMKPVVILDTMIRFSESGDENASMQNKQFVNDVIALRQAGAIAVISIHHATKAMRKEGMKLETVLRGTGDIAASADAVYGLLRDEILHDRSKGPEEIEVVCVKARDFSTPYPFRLALTKKAASSTAISGTTKPGIVSVIDELHDFAFITVEQNARDAREKIDKLVQAEPQITLAELMEATGESLRSVRKIVEQLGWVKATGGSGKNKSGAKTWQKTEVGQIAQTHSAAELADDGSFNTVSFETPA